MIITKYLIEYLRNPKRFIYFARDRGYFKWMKDEQYLKFMFKVKMGTRLNLTNPQTFNEKLQWLKLNDRKPIYTQLADKYEVRKYISENIGEEYLIPLIGVWSNFDDIDFSVLPEQFVLKCTHDSGSVFICTDKKNFNIEKVKKQINKSLKRNYYSIEREWPYKNIEPRIICEKFISTNNVAPDDYKVLCFNGEARLIGVHIDRFGDYCIDNYDRNWNKTLVGKDGPMSNRLYPKPIEFDKMIGFSEKISSQMAHVRVDWFIVNDKLYFGEITFYEAAGYDHFDNKDDDYLLGSWIDLSDFKK